MALPFSDPQDSVFLYAAGPVESTNRLQGLNYPKGDDGIHIPNISMRCLLASELQYLRPTTLTTWSHSQWCDAILRTPACYYGFYITKVQHMKDFHGSRFHHEFLRLTISSGDPETDSYLFVERMTDRDQVTAGWTWNHKDHRFTGSDLMYTIAVPPRGIPITELPEILRKTHKVMGTYFGIERNCYGFAVRVYDDLHDAAKKLYPAKKDAMERAEYYHSYRGIYAEILSSGSAHKMTDMDRLDAVLW